MLGNRSGYCGIIGLVLLVLFAVAIGSLKGCLYRAGRVFSRNEGAVLPRTFFGVEFGEEPGECLLHFDETGSIEVCDCGFIRSRSLIQKSDASLTFGSAEVFGASLLFLNTGSNDTPVWRLFRIKFH